MERPAAPSSKISELNMDAVEQDEARAISRLCDLWVGGHVVNQPVRAGPDFACQIGHRWFIGGRDAWRLEVGR